MDADIIHIKVGSLFPLYKQSITNLKGQDGVFFEASELEQGYLLCICFASMTCQESEAIRKLPGKMRLFQQGDWVIPLIRFGGTTLIFEMVLDPTLYGDERALQFTKTNNTVTIYGIDSNTGIVKVIRAANLPLKMIQTCSGFWRKAIDDKAFSAPFKQWYLGIRSIPLEVLWTKAIDAGELGEHYDINGINL